MHRKGFIFIPDISGFSHFVNSVELEHSQHIIKELLEILIEANQMQLKISEVEGDAILFYSLGEMPDLKRVYLQVEKMFLSFHRHLLKYESLRTCHCKACVSVINLTLKVISHFGEFAEYKVGSFNKLIGKDIIIAHQLLKNAIPKHEYWLISADISEKQTPAPFEPWMQWDYGIQKTDHGESYFYFTQLGPLRNSDVFEKGEDESKYVM